MGLLTSWLQFREAKQNAAISFLLSQRRAAEHRAQQEAGQYHPWTADQFAAALDGDGGQMPMPSVRPLPGPAQPRRPAVEEYSPSAALQSVGQRMAQTRDRLAQSQPSAQPAPQPQMQQSPQPQSRSAFGILPRLLR